MGGATASITSTTTTTATVANRGGGDEDVEDGDDEERHDGNVVPHDLLCTITLSDGRRVRLHCCVGGTVIEVNRNLLLPPQPPGIPDGDDGDDDVGGAADAAGGGGGGIGPSSPLIRDPLLDGYLAVIMPGKRSMFPPPPPRTEMKRHEV